MKQRLSKNLKWAGIVVLIIFGMIVINNLIITEKGTYSFGFCDVKLKCRGIGISSFCLGAKNYHVNCINPNKSKDHYRMVEAECGILAYGLCNTDSKNYQEMEWTSDPNATYLNKSCKAWAQEDKRINLLSCNQTFGDIESYKTIG